MKSAVEDISSIKKKIRIDVPPEDLAKERQKAIADLARKVTIPGFRPGKAPKAVVERHYGDSVKSDVISKMVSSAYAAALREHNLHPVDDPQISDLSHEGGTALSFSATVEVRPPIQLGTYDGIEVKEQEIAVADEDVEQTISRLREMYASLEVVEGRPAEQGDTLVVDFAGTREGKPIEGAKATDHMITLGQGTLIPGFEEQLIGMSKGETKDITVTFPGDYTSKELAGKEAVFTVTVKEIKKAVMPEIDDEFAESAGGHKSVQELRDRIREDLEARKRSERDSSQREELLSKLVDAHSFEVPEGMVERELQSMLKQQATRMARQGMDLKTFDVAKFRDERKALAERRIKGLLILDEIAEKEKVSVTDEELQADLHALARSTGQTVSAIRSYYEQTEGGLENLRASLIQQKTLALLLSRARKVYN